MPTNVNFNGTTYPIPLAGELNWSSLSNFLIDVGNNAGLQTIGKQAIRVAVSSPITVSATTDYTIVTNLTVPGAVTVNLPAGVVKQIFVVVDGKGDAGINNITINPSGGDTISGGGSLVLNHNREAVILQYSTGNWNVIGNTLPSGTITPADIVGVIPPDKGGTGISNNAASTLAISGNFSTAITVSAPTSITFPVSGTLATLAGTEVLTNKDIDGGIAANSRRITVPSNTLANLTTLARKEGTIVYATDTDKLYSDDGASLNQVGSGTATISSNIRPSEGGGTVTLTNADIRTQVFNLSAPEVVILPTTSVLAGDVWQIASRVPGQTLTVQASDASLIIALDYGTITFVPLISTPVTASDWQVISPLRVYGDKTGTPSLPGYMGEFMDIFSPGVIAPNATFTNVAGMDLDPGIWDVSGTVEINGATGMNNLQAAISTTSGSLDNSTGKALVSIAAAQGTPCSIATPVRRINLTVTTTIWLIGFSTFTGGSATYTSNSYLRGTRVG